MAIKGFGQMFRDVVRAGSTKLIVGFVHWCSLKGVIEIKNGSDIEAEAREYLDAVKERVDQATRDGKSE